MNPRSRQLPGGLWYLVRLPFGRGHDRGRVLRDELFRRDHRRGGESWGTDVHIPHFRNSNVPVLSGTQSLPCYWRKAANLGGRAAEVGDRSDPHGLERTPNPELCVWEPRPALRLVAHFGRRLGSRLCGNDKVPRPRYGDGATFFCGGAVTLGETEV